MIVHKKVSGYKKLKTCPHCKNTTFLHAGQNLQQCNNCFKTVCDAELKKVTVLVKTTNTIKEDGIIKPTRYN